MRTFVAGVALFVLSQAVAAAHSASMVEQQALLKRWALSRCLGKVYADAAVKRDAEATASIYLEAGIVPADAYSAVDQLATDYANRHYTGSIDSSFGTKKCIDLFDGKPLDHLTKRLVNPPRLRR
ncbi:T6SS amidase immunity protein Tai4 family protein [Caballeronia grimmiae]|nr:T6SS amidase immunity protein Tai4 family protein [Caballeronia grimmiae]GGD56415.1 hypothetical protein GCM10010985_07660 [Caballeronia grimmiae]